MNQKFLLALVFLGCVSPVFAGDGGALDVENDVVTSAYANARRGDDTNYLADLLRPSDARLNASSDLVFIRRAARVCSLLKNDNDLKSARRVGRIAIARLKTSRQFSDDDQVERLYWGAWINSDILDQQSDALALVQQAEQMAPDQRRLQDLHQRISALLAPQTK